MKIAFAMHVSVPEDVLVRELDGESVILNLNNGQYFGLDEVGTRMFQVLSKSRSIESAFKVLLLEYDVSEDLLRRDLHDLVEKMVKHGLVELKTG